MSKSDLPDEARDAAAVLRLCHKTAAGTEAAELLDALADEIDRLRKRRRRPRDVRELDADELVEIACTMLEQARDQVEETLRRAGVEPVPQGASASMVAAVAHCLDVRGAEFWRAVEWTLNAIKGKVEAGPCPVPGCGGE